MHYDEILRLLRQRPFQPFAVVLKDGRVFEIKHLGIHLLLKDYFNIGIPTPDPDPVADRWESIPLDEIDQLAPLPTP